MIPHPTRVFLLGCPIQDNHPLAIHHSIQIERMMKMKMMIMKTTPNLGIAYPTIEKGW